MVGQLGDIERRWLLLLERQDLIKSLPDKTVTQYKSFIEAEKSVFKDRKQIRYERKKQQEKDFLIDQKAKLDKRMNRQSQMKSVMLVKNRMFRSNKPELLRNEDDGRDKITQEQLDFIKYVEGGGRDLASQLKNI